MTHTWSVGSASNCSTTITNECPSVRSNLNTHHEVPLRTLKRLQRIGLLPCCGGHSRWCWYDDGEGKHGGGREGLYRRAWWNVLLVRKDAIREVSNQGLVHPNTESSDYTVWRLTNSKTMSQGMKCGERYVCRSGRITR